MRKVKLKFLGLGYMDKYQADIFIYDRFNNLVYHGNTYNGELILCLKEKLAYKLIARFNDNIIFTIFYVDNYSNYTFCFGNVNNNITLLLSDYYYDNLPIERGELIIWQKM